MSEPHSKSHKSIEEHVDEGVRIAQAILTGAADKVPPETRKVVASLIVTIAVLSISPHPPTFGWAGG